MEIRVKIERVKIRERGNEWGRLPSDNLCIARHSWLFVTSDHEIRIELHGSLWIEYFAEMNGSDKVWQVVKTQVSRVGEQGADLHNTELRMASVFELAKSTLAKALGPSGPSLPFSIGDPLPNQDYDSIWRLHRGTKKVVLNYSGLWNKECW